MKDSRKVSRSYAHILIRTTRMHFRAVGHACILALFWSTSISMHHHSTRYEDIGLSRRLKFHHYEESSKTEAIFQSSHTPRRKNDTLLNSHATIGATKPNVADSKSVYNKDNKNATQNSLLSPYEARWPGFKLPRWAQKRTRDLSNNKVPENQQLCFVHVGKTGGSTIGCRLGFQLHCKNKQSAPGVLPQLATHMVHNDVDDCSPNTKRYLVSVRNPVDRIRSAFVYERPGVNGTMTNYEMNRNRIYEECGFTTLNELAEQGLDSAGNATQQCKFRAYKHIHGMQQYGYHCFYNYRRYYEEAMKVEETTEIYLIRNEHLIDDWNQLEVLFGGPSQALQSAGRDNPGQTSNRILSDAAQRILCDHLSDEIQIYKELLVRAVNLDALDVQMSLKELGVSCPNLVGSVI